MLRLLNRYAHGYVAVPVIVSLRKRGGFDRLAEDSSCEFARLVEEMAANAGHLRVALRLLESLGWCAVDEDERIRLTEAARAHRCVPMDLPSLLGTPVDAAWLTRLGRTRLVELVQRSADRWGGQDPRFADMIDGAFLVPLLLSLSQSVTLDGERAVVSLADSMRDPLESLFIVRGWAAREDRELRLTEMGRTLLDRIPITGTVASYRPMLARMDELLFGNAAAVFERDIDGHESHIDRGLNVFSSGFQHEKFFADLETCVVDIFNRLPIEEQPNYVADMGCGDGTLLKRIYETIVEHSARGKLLAKFPVTLIGIDYNQKSLDATAKNLAGLPHRVLPGDIGDPQRLLDDLRQLGITDPERILHVRSFLDHDRPFRVPDDEEAVRRRHVLPFTGAYTRLDGTRLASTTVGQSLVEHLRRWSTITNRFGLIILEVHALPPRVVQEFIDQSENLHYDAFHGFSGQLLVEPDQFLMAAAEAGLFPDPQNQRRYPRLLPYTRITLSRFEPRSYLVRHARAEDLPAFEVLEAECWAEGLRTPTAALAQRVERYPRGQFVLEMAGQVAGVLYTQRIVDPKSLESASAVDIDQLFDQRGRFVQLIAVNVSPRLQQQGLGDQLIEFVLQVCSVSSGIERAVGVTRCRDYVNSDADSLAEYVDRRTPAGDRVDPILRFHESHGAEIKQLLPGYRPQDTDNEGCGVLIEYDVRQRRVKHQKKTLARPTTPPPSTATTGAATTSGATKAKDCATFVASSIRSILGPDREEEYAPERPLMDQDLDSMDLVELGTILSRHFQREIDATFFFAYPTPAAIVRYLAGTGTAATEVPLAHSPGDLGNVHSPPAGTDSPAIPAPPNPELLQLTDTIAIVGMACRFPGGVSSPEDFWQLLRNGVDTASDIPSDRWDVDTFYDANPETPDKMYTRLGCFIDNADQFDADFFGITPREAMDLDPQQRLLLEVTWEALECAGIAPASLRGSDSGVFVGLTWDDAMLRQNEDGLAGNEIYKTLGNARSLSAGRMAYFLDWHGPVMQIDTACSSSLVSVHQACESLRSGECDLATAGGVNLMLSPATMIALCRLTALAPDGRCKTFDAAADGYARGEGCGMVVLKRMADAIRDGNSILAQIRATAINHDGASNGLTAPNGQAQEQLIRKTLKKAKLVGRDVTYVEAHGTGTELGDPIELSALHAVYGENRPSEEPLFVGSTKTNIGHLEAAAGIAGLLKVVLMLQHREIPPHLNFDTPNPHIDWSAMSIKVPTVLSAWPDSDARGLAAVSAFGFSGTNAHVIVERAEATSLSGKSLDSTSTEITSNGARGWPFNVDSATPAPPLYLLPLSAKSEESLLALAQKYAKQIDTSPDQAIEDICFTAATARDHFKYRIAVVAVSRDELLEKLRAFASGDDRSQVITDRRGPKEQGVDQNIGFLFTGQGTHYAGLGRDLYQTQPVFRKAIDRCAGVLADQMDVALTDLLYPDATVSDLLINQTMYAQPGIFAVEYALVELWKSWGVRPTAVLGHSLGEYAAANVAGVLDLEAALTLTATRGRLGQTLLQSGAMAVVMADEARVRAILAAFAAEVSIAALNGPDNVVISGQWDAVEDVASRFLAAGIDTEMLNTASAGHSALVEPMLEPYRDVAERFTYSSPTIDMISNVTGQVAGAEVADSAYWVKHLREPVRFADGMRAMAETGCRIFLEIGPNPNLLAMGMGCLKNLQPRPCWLPSLTKDRSGWETMLYSLGELYVRGAAINWQGFYEPYACTRVALPTYAFQHQSFPASPMQSLAHGVRSSSKSRLPQPTAVARKVDHLRIGLEDEAQALTLRLDEVAIHYVIDAVRQLGFEWHPGAEISEIELYARIPTRHRPKAARVFSRLVERGWVEHAAGIYRVTRPAPDGCAAALLDALEQDCAYPECDMLRRGGTALAAIWQGDAEPLSVLFPDGGTDHAAAFYSQAKFLAGYNEIAGAVLCEAVAALPATATLRVLEVGAGTGGLTMHLLPRLPADRCEYVFTDVSPLFLHAAHARFGEFPFLQTQLLDISTPPLDDDFAANSFDLVVAANVLHATPRLRETLTHVRQLLKPNGWLMLLEAANPPFWGDAVFTLIDGWWSFEDRELRPEYPLMRRDGWCQVLGETGFDEVACLNDAKLQDESTNTLYLAQSRTALAPHRPRAIRPPRKSSIEAISVTPPKSETAGARDRPTIDGSLADVFDEDELSNLVLTHAASVMRRKPEAIERNQPLSELGMDSLMATELRAQLGYALGRELSLNMLQMRRSVKEIVAYVRVDQSQETASAKSEDGILSDLEVNAARVHLVPLQPLGSRPPLFFVPAGYGDMFAFQDIAHAMGLDQPVYGLQPASANQVKTFRQMSIYRLVSAYISEIKKAQPSGPYFLSGYSVGAIIAVEIARELLRQGNEVGLLVIFDPPSHIPFWLDWFYSANYRFSTRTGLSRLVRRVRSPWVTRLFHTVLDEGLRTHTTVAREHRVAPYPGRITYFRATLSQGSLVSFKPIGRFWRRIALEGVEVHWIPGTHYGMLRGPGAGVVVDELSDCLQRSRMR